MLSRRPIDEAQHALPEEVVLGAFVATAGPGPAAEALTGLIAVPLVLLVGYLNPAAGWWSVLLLAPISWLGVALMRTPVLTVRTEDRLVALPWARIGSGVVPGRERELPADALTSRDDGPPELIVGGQRHWVRLGQVEEARRVALLAWPAVAGTPDPGVATAAD